MSAGAEPVGITLGENSAPVATATVATATRREPESGRGPTQASRAPCQLPPRMPGQDPWLSSHDRGPGQASAGRQRRIEHGEWLSPPDRSFLLERLEKLKAQYSRLEFVVPAGVIHGDASVDNVIGPGSESQDHLAIRGRDRPAQRPVANTIAEPHCRETSIGIRSRPDEIMQRAFPITVPNDFTESSAFIAWPGVGEVVSRSPTSMEA
jgi:hypothetical protein